MRLVIEQAKCVSKLAPGEAKRVPKHATSGLVGYYLACPYCGIMCILLAMDQKFDESDAGVSMDKTTCARPSCRRSFSIDRGEFVAEAS